MNKLDYFGVVVVWLMILIVMAGVSFIMGVTMAYYLDQAESRLPDVWAGEVKKIDGYNQIPHKYDEQPAHNIVELEHLQTL